MVALTSCEILEELNKLGITTTQEIVEYVIDYSKYHSGSDTQPERKD